MPETAITVLLVEDSETDADLIEAAVAAEGEYVVRKAESLKDALDALGGDAPDAVLLDLGLPDSQGLDTLRAVIEKADGVPVIVLTGLEDKEVGIAAVRMGADDYLIKRADFAGQGELVSRAICYAIERRNLQAQVAASEAKMRVERQMEELKSIEPAQPSDGPLKDRDPGRFAELSGRYGEILRNAVDGADEGAQAVLDRLSRDLGALGAGPQDVIDIHRDALQALTANQDADRISALVDEGHVTSIGVMGMLVMHYRDRRG